TPPHRHTRYPEQVYLLEGELTVWLGEQKFVVHPGDCFAIPVGVPHTIETTGSGPAHVLGNASSSAFARLLTEVSTPDRGETTPPSALPDMALYARFLAVLGDELLGPAWRSANP